jgi:hypothetical protein
MVKHIGFMVAILVIALLMFYFAVSFESQWLESLVITGPEMTLDEWRDLFSYWAAIGIIISVAAALLWFGLGQWVFSMDRWTTANNKRSVWLMLGALALAAAIPGIVMMPVVQEGGRLAWPLYLLNNLIVFFVSTLIFSPSSFKYTPVGASFLRPLRQWW